MRAGRREGECAGFTPVLLGKGELASRDVGPKTIAEMVNFTCGPRSLGPTVIHPDGVYRLRPDGSYELTPWDETPGEEAGE